jgi:hypothetical protein
VTDPETEDWLRQLFADEATQLSWADVRGFRRKARLPRSAVHTAIRELEFAGELQCDRSADDSNAWLWRRKAAARRDHEEARSADAADDPTKAVMDRAELIDLLDAARRLTHPDVTRAPIPRANEVTAKLNAMVDRLRSR